MLFHKTVTFWLLICLVLNKAWAASDTLAATVQCTSCNGYQLTMGSNILSISCPLGTTCSTATGGANICATSNKCDGVVCDKYAVFPSTTNCQQFHTCRYWPSYGYVLSTTFCPGSSRFDANTGKCTLNGQAACYTPTMTSDVVTGSTTPSTVTPLSTTLS